MYSITYCRLVFSLLKISRKVRDPSRNQFDGFCLLWAFFVLQNKVIIHNVISIRLSVLLAQNNEKCDFTDAKIQMCVASDITSTRDGPSCLFV